MEKTFTQRYIDGECEFSAIDDCIETWHNSKGGVELTLEEYLGLTDEEYMLFLKTSDELRNHLDHLKEAAK